ncbi:MAG: hypothetical protein V5A61_00780 [Haloarculaceae archaeon]
MTDETSAPAEEPATETEEPATETGTGGGRTMLASRIAVTWAEVVLVGFAGAALGGATSGPPQLVVYLATTLVSVAVLLYNVDRLIRDRIGR